MELLDRYIQAVRFWLPKTTREEDLITELGEDLRSQMEDKAEELGRPLEKAEIAAILRRCGSPMMVAGRLGPQRHLIGPALFPIYEFVLKMVLLWILVPVFIFIVAPVNVANSSGHWGLAVASTIGDLWSGLFIAAGTITLVFAVIERTNAHWGTEIKWDPLKLPPVRKEEHKQPSRLKTVSEFGFNVFGLVWLLLVPYHPWMILGPTAAFLKAAPIWHTVYLPIVVLAIAAVLRPAMILARPHWSWFPLPTQLVQTVITLILVKFMINAATQTPASEWYPFLALADSVRNSPHYIGIAAIVNVSVLLSLVFTWFGVCIAAIVQTWQLMRYFLNRASHARDPALLRMM